MENGNFFRQAAMHNEQSSAEKEYWLNRLAGNPTKSCFPYDYKETAELMTYSAAGGFRGSRLTSGLNGELFSRLLKMSNQSDPLLHMILTAAFTVLMQKYTGNNDIITGTTIYRQEEAGDFINTLLPLRNDVNRDMSFKELVLKIRQTMVEAVENQGFPVEMLPGELGMPDAEQRFPLFDVAVLLENIHDKKHIEHLNIAFLATFNRTEEALELEVEYCQLLYEHITITRLLSHLTNLLEAAVENPQIAVDRINIVSPAERRRILVDFNDTKRDFPSDKCFHQLFAGQVERYPEKTAAVYKDESITYSRLNRMADRVAGYLYHEKDVRPNQPVGLMIHRSIGFMIALLGILKAGGVYVPIEPLIPEERVKKIIDDAEIRVVLTQKKFIRTLNRLQWECDSFETFLCMDSWDIYAVDEEEKGELVDQEKLWEYVGKSATDEITGGGWFSSYTGEPFSPKEMAEYGDNILAKLSPILHREIRVLEIGCASGITMYRLAPRVGFYYGTDFSNSIIEKNKEKVREDGLKNIALSCLAAHEIGLDTLKQGNFDLIIMNSVIQSFHGYNYLRRVLRKAVDLLNPGGYIFVGDVMDQDLKNDLLTDLNEFRRNSAVEKHRTKVDFSTELFVSRKFLQDMALEIPCISSIEFSDKIHTIENELTKFRYDSLIRVAEKPNESSSVENRKKYRYQQDLRALEPYDKGEKLPDLQLDPHNLAYINYTSGTTGRPKGVTIHHQGMINHLYAKINDLGLTSGDVVAQTASAAFDISVWQFLAGLLVGGTVYIIEKETVLEPSRFLKVLQQGNVSILETVPSLMSAFLDMVESEPDKELRHLRWMIPTGEALTIQLTGEWYKHYPFIKLVNAYGPTEASDDVTHYVVRQVPEENRLTVPIGKPLQNLHIYIVDKNLSLCPIGVRGEICVAGVGVGKGYWKEPGKTASAFVPNPFLAEIEDKTYDTLYRTGDIGFFREDGNVECLGRLDHQVKIRGNRIELGEIEHQLIKHPDIRQSVVIVRETQSGDKTICAYVVLHKDKGIDVGLLREFLAAELPDYMIPAFFVPLAELPLTINGKVDAKALPDPQLQVGEGHVAPGDEVEERLAHIWADVLDIDESRIGIHSNFFEKGGHSLLAVILVTKIHKEFNVKVPIETIFETPTIEDIAGCIKYSDENLLTGIPLIPERDHYPASSAQKRMFLIQQLKGKDSISENIPELMLIAGDLDPAHFEAVFGKLIRRHEILRTSIHLLDDEIIQKIHKEEELDFNVPYFDAVEEDIPRLLEKFSRPFDLGKAPMFRVALAKLPDGKHLMFFEIHHIITDGTSWGILMRDFISLYDGRKLPELRVQYKDFTVWQNKLLASDVMKKQESYWLDVFSGEIPELDIPTDFPKPEVQVFEGNILFFEMDRSLTRKVTDIIRSSNVTLYMFLLAVYNVLLHKYSGQEDIVVGAPIQGRHHPDLEHLIGFFVNTLAIRNYPLEEKSFSDFLEEVRNSAVKAYENQDYQFEELVSKLGVAADPGRHPLFRTMFQFLNVDSPEVDERLELESDPAHNISKLTFTSYKFEETIIQFDLLLHAIEKQDTVGFKVLYSTRLFKIETIENFARHFIEVVSAVVENMHVKMKNIAIFHGLDRLDTDILDDDGDFGF
ncbi:MAG: AMP-binding protein [bacterium]|nr:AMP-binding protein [bacterium]